MIKRFLALVLLLPGLAIAQTESATRTDYENERNGAHFECDTEWTTLRSGLEYRAITCLGKDQEPELDLHAIRLDPDEWVVNAYVSKDASARKVAQDKKAVFAINANFFDTERNALGLVVRSEEQVRGLRPTSWQSIFLIRNDGTPRIVRADQWKKEDDDDVFMAVQAGPRLVVNNQKTTLKNTYAAPRAGVCIRDRSLIFFATPSDRKFHMKEIARIASRSEEDGGLDCDDAMLFDGGHSTQLYLNAGEKRVSVKGDPAPVFVYAKEREERRAARGSRQGQ